MLTHDLNFSHDLYKNFFFCDSPCHLTQTINVTNWDSCKKATSAFGTFLITYRLKRKTIALWLMVAVRHKSYKIRYKVKGSNGHERTCCCFLWNAFVVDFMLYKAPLNTFDGGKNGSRSTNFHYVLINIRDSFWGRLLYLFLLFSVFWIQVESMKRCIFLREAGET